MSSRSITAIQQINHSTRPFLLACTYTFLISFLSLILKTSNCIHIPIPPALTYMHSHPREGATQLQQVPVCCAPHCHPAHSLLLISSREAALSNLGCAGDTLGTVSDEDKNGFGCWCCLGEFGVPCWDEQCTLTFPSQQLSGTLSVRAGICTEPGPWRKKEGLTEKVYKKCFWEMLPTNAEVLLQVLLHYVASDCFSVSFL